MKTVRQLLDQGSRSRSWTQPAALRPPVPGEVLFLTAKGHGNIMVRFYDVAPDGTGVIFDEQVFQVNPGRIASDLR